MPDDPTLKALGEMLRNGQEKPIKEAFKKAMKGKQYGEEETRDAYAWFKEGWKARMP